MRRAQKKTYFLSKLFQIEREINGIYFRIMFETFNEEELQRYEDWQVSKFSNNRIKKVNFSDFH